MLTTNEAVLIEILRQEENIDEGYRAEVKGGKMNIIPTETGKIFYRVFGNGAVMI